ncbi:hypothetical protein [Spirilliplanes yamanashiensis]|uniref:Uncharacterized protein n=1 Tax=Spirilliplanes yamanashiensis TaxID=42233 RepID=A0A8J3Y5Z3_9ACTN|nr:hypothetical protein [Spirilliplanes yamanashiensis]MDP9819189.1 hypothetical protein [Spirilliplanes yamanashiensis]GIJ01988.1 hypothetical protein Sya03_13400 [Spirilliplanes yamanashiensis]
MLTGDPEHNRRTLQDRLDGPPGVLELPPGAWPLAGGLRVPAGWTVRGPGAWLDAAGPGDEPVLHVLGSDVVVEDVGVRPAPSEPGEHGGDRGTGVTVGEYLYAAPPTWIAGVTLRRVRVEAPTRSANAVAVMGAVRGVTVDGADITGGHTGVAVHWGAVGGDVHTVRGPTYHPHDLTITGLRVRDAVEGFYLSSVHDAAVRGACLSGVDMGFRLLPGDNTARFAGPEVGRRITVEDVCVRWRGPRYAVRVAGWGRSEIDGAVSVLRYADTAVRRCTLRRDAGDDDVSSWSPLVLESVAGVTLDGVVVESPSGGPCCPLAGSSG